MILKLSGRRPKSTPRSDREAAVMERRLSGTPTVFLKLEVLERR